MGDSCIGSLFVRRGRVGGETAVKSSVRKRSSARAPNWIREANPCLQIEEHKQKQEKTQPNYSCMINLRSWGLTNQHGGKTVLDRII